MISLLKYKELLGEEAQGLTDQEIESLRDAQYQFARLAFQEWLIKKNLVKTLYKSEKI